MEITLKPEVKLQPRYWILAVIVLLLLCVPYLGPWWARLLGCILPVILTGTYRVSTVNGDKFQTQLFFGFVPLNF